MKIFRIFSQTDGEYLKEGIINEVGNVVTKNENNSSFLVVEFYSPFFDKNGSQVCEGDIIKIPRLGFWGDPEEFDYYKMIREKGLFKLVGLFNELQKTKAKYVSSGFIIGDKTGIKENLQ